MHDLREKTKKALERVPLFNDSKEIALGVNEIDDYWAREACVHIEGLWQLTKQLKQLLSRAIKHINDLESEIAEQARVNGMGSEREARLMALNGELVEALRCADAMLSGANMDAKAVKRKVSAALAKVEASK